MKSRFVVAIVVLCSFGGAAFGDPNMEIRYAASELGAGRWQYTYTVENLTGSQIPEIEEFTIWFGYGLFDELLVTTPESPAGWNQIVWDPEPMLLDDGAYDAETLDSGIGIGQIVGDFSVSFDWLGGGEPGSQFYEIIDPTDYHTIEDGYTVPEPATLFLLGLGGLVLLRRRKA